MNAKKWTDLYNTIPANRREAIDARVRSATKEMPLHRLRQARRYTQKQLAEAMQFYNALQFRGIPTGLMVVPGAFHDLAARPSHVARGPKMLDQSPGVGRVRRFQLTGQPAVEPASPQDARTGAGHPRRE